MPAQAFQKTSFADGSFEYSFAAPSLDIRGAGDLNLAGLSFIEGVADGFRVGASFDLDWLGGEQALLASPASTWRGLEMLPRTLSFVAGGNLDLGTIRLTLIGGTISLTAGGALSLGNGSVIDTGNAGGVDLSGPRLPLSRPPALTAGGGTLQIVPGGNISLTAGGARSLGNGSVIDTGNGGGVDLSVPGLSLSRLPALTAGGGTLQIVPGGNISLTGPLPVPEPTTTALLLAGLAGLAGMFGRRAKAKR